MASPYILDNPALQLVNVSGTDYSFYLAFLNPITVTTNWNDLNLDNQGNWQPPPNYDTLAHKVQPYAPTANLGPNRIGFVGEPLYFDGSRSCQRFDLPVVSYSWSYSGNPTPATQLNQHFTPWTALIWQSPGLYTISLTVTDRYGSSTTGTRQVMIYQDRSNALPGLISISGLSGSLSGGGWQCQITTVNSQVTLFPPDQLQVGQYQPIVVMCETRYEVSPGIWYDATLGPLGTFSPGYPYVDPRIFFDGYVQNGTYHQDIDKDTLSFTCAGPQMILQEAQTHQLGYYNGTYQGYHNNVPSSLKPSPAGAGFIVGGLTSTDVVNSLLQTHTSIGAYHDIHMWVPSIPTSIYAPGNTNATYTLTYTTLSVNNGTVWQNVSDLVGNEWAQAYCERNGSINIGPQVNFRGSDYWQNPTLLGSTQATSFINFVQDLGFTVGDDITQMSSKVPTIPAQPMPVQFVHPWSHMPIPSGVWQPFGIADANLRSKQAGQNGPPYLCTFTDTPIYDDDPPIGGPSIFPWTTNVNAGLGQDLAVYPISFDFPTNYSGRTSLVKLVGTLYGHTTLWTAWYPQNAFNVVGDGAVSLVTSVLPAGNWVVDESHLLADVTTTQNATLMGNWWWEIARRVWYAANIHYTGTITLGMFTACSLGDIVGVTRQNNTLGPHWNAKPFYVTEIAYNVDLTSRTWTTTINVNEVTSILMGPIIPRPKKLPKS